MSKQNKRVSCGKQAGRLAGRPAGRPTSTSTGLTEVSVDCELADCALEGQHKGLARSTSSMEKEGGRAHFSVGVQPERQMAVYLWS